MGLQTTLTRPDDPERLVQPLGAGQAWGQLVPSDGPFVERPLALMRQIVLLGREPDCDIVVRDGQASRHHAELRWDHGRVHLVDRGSLNGTRVNGLGVFGQVPLRSGDVIEIGATAYRFETTQAGAQGPIAVTPQLSSVDAEETR
jgi:predicted component of type VI protein secretion system